MLHHVRGNLHKKVLAERTRNPRRNHIQNNRRARNPQIQKDARFIILKRNKKKLYSLTAVDTLKADLKSFRRRRELCV